MLLRTMHHADPTPFAPAPAADLTAAAQHVYIHVPFCSGKCLYCGFYSVRWEKETANRWIDALRHEIEKTLPGRATPRTIYMGGGTPSLLDEAQCAALCGYIRALFDLRGLARKLSVSVDALPRMRVSFAERLRDVETSGDALKAAEAALAEARNAYLEDARTLSAARAQAGERLAEAVMGELAPLKLDKARFRVAVEALSEERAGPTGLDRVTFEIATNPGAPFGDLGAIASGGELARFALALKAALAGRSGGPQPLMIFDEVDQGVGGAVADAVGLRLKRLAGSAQVLVVTHSPQVAARGDAHWRIAKAGEGERVRTLVEALPPGEREEEIARMLAGAEVTDAARAAARALIR